MISSEFNDVHNENWRERYLINQQHELLVFYEMIPWQTIIPKLTKFYSPLGSYGKNLRMMVAIQILTRYRQLSDRKVIKAIEENRYTRYFCNIPDKELFNFADHASICNFRNRVGPEGASIIEDEIFNVLRNSGAIKNDLALIDSSVLANNIIYPNDVRLLKHALGMMINWSEKNEIPLWFDPVELTKLWRNYRLNKNASLSENVVLFYQIFSEALEGFNRILKEELPLIASLQGQAFLEVFEILEVQTHMKVCGEIHIKDRLVSLHETEARPIIKGKEFPKCEFGTTNEMSFNRQGYMVTCKILIGNPNDKTLYPSTLLEHIDRMSGNPEGAITDLGYRSKANLKVCCKEIEHIYMGRMSDVPDNKKKEMKSARCATEGFIAVAKNLRGFGKSLYHGLRGDKIWAKFSQISYNLKKYLLLEILNVNDNTTLSLT